MFLSTYMALLARTPQLSPCHPPALRMESVQKDKAAALEAQRQARLRFANKRAAFTYQIQQGQRAFDIFVLLPCNLCGQPTGHVCNGCKNLGAQLLCSTCADMGDRCRLCVPR